MDYETQKVYHLMVTARDTAPDPRSSTANVTIFVEDQEDMVPIFEENLYIANVPENRNGFEVTTVQVRNTALKL